MSRVDLVAINGTMITVSCRLAPLIVGATARQAASRTAQVQAMLPR